MRFVKQKEGITVFNLDNRAEDKVKDKHGKLLPSNLRALFIGSSRSGETNALLSLIFAQNGLAFENIYLYSESLDQPKYRLLETMMDELLNDGMNFYESTNSEEVIDPKDAKPDSIPIPNGVAHKNYP
ncbi:hypothetical protein QAD02_012760 [Eretmocerus hayati]|uniref:Uncharacterized protein n=1 Tax=Eretmocerus hayati TaxID=131215 RepID=A0ACC2P0L0_9HYME|nr:hypothetical protein QAD02_012760 [Eretmocerus hayati]